MTIDVTQFMRRPNPDAFSMERLFEDIRGAMTADCRVKVWTCSNLSRGFWPRLQDSWKARFHQGQVNHVTGDVHFLTLLLSSRRTVLTVHDLAVLDRLRGIRRWVLWFFWFWLPARRSRVIVAISEASRRKLLESVRCDPAKVRVIHNAVSREFQPAPRSFDEACPRLLQIGTKSNKNLERVAEALRGIRCRLAIVGPLSEAQAKALRRNDIDYENLLHLSREGLLAEYVRCDMLVFASISEGFGLPIIEANAVGRPVVTSNASSMPEVAGNSACLVDPLSVSSIRDGVLRVIEDESYRRELVAAGYVNAERFSVAAIAMRYADVYREIAADGSAAPQSPSGVALARPGATHS